MNEQQVELEAIARLADLGIPTRLGSELPEAGLEPHAGLIGPVLRDALIKLNPEIDHDAIEQVVRTLRQPPHPTLNENNRWFHALLTDGVEVEYKDAKTQERRGGRAQLIDFDKPEKNDFLVVRQLTLRGENDRVIRPDLVLFVNGLPLVAVELKDPTNSSGETDLRAAHRQLQRYRDTAPELFIPNLLIVASDGLLTRVGSLTCPWSRFAPWRPLAPGSTPGSEGGSEAGQPTLEALIRGLLIPEGLIDYLRACVIFEEDQTGTIIKKVAGYHQFRAVQKARASVLAALQPDGDGHGGVIWHTQGSGKSLTMLMLAGALIRDEKMANPTIVVVTDRNDLDQQLFDTFADGRALLRQAPEMAESREDLGRRLDRASGGVVFTTIQKFAEAHEKISERTNIVVMADEAHRSQYGFVDGGARRMREALPGATFVGFTGTPISTLDANTRGVFGEYTDIYDVRQSVADGATVPIYYEPRIIKLKVDEAGAAEVERVIASMAQADDEGTKPEEDVKVRMLDLIGAPDRVAQLAKFIVGHWAQRRGAMEGKAMVVTSSRDIAARLYEAIQQVPEAEDWHHDGDDSGQMKVVISGGPDDPEHLLRHVRTKEQRKRLAERFKKPTDDFRLAIVCDMWLTGFDVPCAHTMYLDKPLAGHNLMQAIARVNRVYGDKPGGLIVDTINLTDELADALATYADASGKDEKPVQEIQDEAVPAMEEAFQGVRDFFAAFDYVAALDAEPRAVLSIYMHAADYVLAQPGLDGNGNPERAEEIADENAGWKRYRGLVKRLSTAFALAVPHEATQPVASHLAFFQNLSAAIAKRLSDASGNSPASGRGAGAGSRDVDVAVRQVLGGAVDAGEVIDLFAAAGLEEARLDILSDEFLGRVAAMEQKNLALESLRKLLTDQIKLSERRNLVQSRRFREALEDAMLRYTNKQITTAEMIAKLLELAERVREERARGQSEGMSEEEIAFYDALAENGSARDVMKSDALREMARKLTEMMNNIPKLDWTQRESVRADLRRKVRRLLALYGYPPDLSDDATQLVLKQAELSTSDAIQ